MRWRLYIFALSATSLFCFMLLTAATGQGHGVRVDRMAVSAPRASPPARSAMLSAAVGGVAGESPAAPARATSAFDFDVRPQAVFFLVPENADPVSERRAREEEEHRNRGKPDRRFRLKWDENGWHREEVALVTAYCPCVRCCGSQSPGITSIGKDAWTPGLAAEPAYLPYGVRVFVPGYGLRTVDDTGGAMRRHWRQNGLLHIDVRMTYHHEARMWGKQYLRVKIYEE
ncbi:MAG: 3D domain-containing protein [Planctomycetota bacterium]|jgi:3D (Asp-Asp-Asp) domain-containing protein|nr:3D domain-containing protein [Planctomycetota bacterium]